MSNGYQQAAAPQIDDSLFTKIDDFEQRIRVLERQGYDATVGGPAGVAGGDLSGTYPNPKVVRAATNFDAGDNIRSNSGEAGQVRLGARASGGEVAFGSPTDTYVYRKAAGVVGVDNYLDAALGLRISGAALASTHLSDSSDILRTSGIAASAYSFTGGGPAGPSIIVGPTGFNPTSSNQLAMRFTSGSDPTVFGNAQIAFSYDETDTYKHRINTRHNPVAQVNNAIDFFVWQRATDSTTALGTQHVLTLDATGSNITGPLKFNDGMVDLSSVAATSTGVGTGVGDKIALHSTGYGIGIAAGRIVNWVSAATNAVSVRVKSGTGAMSSGSDAISLFGDGKISAIGTGKTALALTSTSTDTGLTIGGDVTLYRSAADTLKTDDVFVVSRAAANTALAAQLDGDAVARWGVAAGGIMSWGDGLVARDTTLYRSVNRAVLGLETQTAFRVTRVAATNQYVQITPGDSAGTYVDALNSETNKKPFIFRNVHGSEGSPTGTQGYAWQNGPSSAPVTLMSMSETGNLNVAGAGAGYAIGGVALKSTHLSDFASIAMLNETETVLNSWTFQGGAIFNQPIQNVVGIDAIGFANSSVPLMRLTAAASPNYALFEIRNSTPTTVFDIDAGGKLRWLSETALNLYRGATGQLKTDATFYINNANGLVINTTPLGTALIDLPAFGTAASNGLQWGGAATLYSDGNFRIRINNDLYLPSGGIGIGTAPLTYMKARIGGVMGDDVNAGSTHYGILLDPDWKPVNDFTDNWSPLWMSSAIDTSTAAGALTGTMYGLNIDLDYTAGTQTLANMTALRVNIGTAAAVGTVTNAYNVRIVLGPTTPVTNLYGLFIDAPAANTTTGVLSGITIESIAGLGATTTRALYAAGGGVRFGANLTTSRSRVGLGVDATVGQLQLTASTAFDDGIFFGTTDAIWRSATSELTSNVAFGVERAVDTNTAFYARQTGDANARFLMTAAGQQQWGAGGASARDVFWGRTAVNQLGFGNASMLDLGTGGGTATTTGNTLGDKIILYNNTYGFGIQSNRIVAWLPSAASFTVRQDSAVGQHSSGTDAVTLSAGGLITATGAGKAALALTSTGTTTGITLGGDTTLYRSAANILRTDDLFQVDQNAIPIVLGDFNTYGIGIWQNVQGALSLGADATSSYIQSWNGRPLRLNSQGQLTYVGGGLSVAAGLTVTSGTITFPVASLNGNAIMDGTLPIGAFGFIFGGNNLLYNSGFEASAVVDADPQATYQPWDGWLQSNATIGLVTKPTSETRASVTLPQATIGIKDAANWTAPGTARMGATTFTFTGITTDLDGLVSLTGCAGGTGTFATGTPITQDPQGVDANRIWGMGNNAVKLTATASATDVSLAPIPARYVPVTPLKTYTGSGYIGATLGSKTGYVRIMWYDNTRTFISASNATTQTFSTTGMTRSYVTASAPGTAAYARVDGVALAASVTAGDIYYFDSFMLSDGDMLFAYEPRADEILPGSINATMIQAGAITGDAIVANFSITGKRIQTSPSGQRVVLEGDDFSTLGEAGLGVYNAAGNLRVRLGEATGMTLFSTAGISDPVLKLADTGGLMVGSPTGARTIFDLSGVSTYDSTPTLRVRMDAASGLTLRDTASNVQVQLSGTGGLQTIGSGGSVFFDSTGLTAYNSTTTFTTATQVIKIDRNTGLMTMGAPSGAFRMEFDRTSMRFYDAAGTLGLYTDFGGLRTSSTTTYASLTSTGLHMVNAGIERVLLDGTAGLTLKDTAGTTRVNLSATGGLKTTGATGTVILDDSGLIGYNSTVTFDNSTQVVRIDRATGAFSVGSPVGRRMEADRTSLRFFNDALVQQFSIINGVLTTGTADSGARVRMDSAGIKAFNSGGVNTVAINSDGSAFFRGQIDVANSTYVGTVNASTIITPGTITTGLLTLEMGGQNLLRNSSFENSVNHVLLWGLNAATSVADTTVFRPGGYGTQSIKLTATGAGQYLNNNSNRAPIQGGRTYISSAWVQYPTSRNVRMTIYGYDAGGVNLGSVQKDTTIPANTWVRVFSPAFVMQALAVTCRINVHDTTSIAGDIMWIDDVQIEEGDTPTAYAPAPGDLPAGTRVESNQNNNLSKVMIDATGFRGYDATGLVVNLSNTGVLDLGPTTASHVTVDRTSMRFYENNGTTIGLTAQSGKISTSNTLTGARVEMDGTTDTFGIYSATQPRVTLDPTNGLRLHNTSGVATVFLSAVGGLTTQAAETSQRVTLNSTGLLSYNTSNQQVFQLDAATGKMIIGPISAAARIEADRTSLTFYQSDGSTVGLVATVGKLVSNTSAVIARVEFDGIANQFSAYDGGAQTAVGGAVGQRLGIDGTNGLRLWNTAGGLGLQSSEGGLVTGLGSSRAELMAGGLTLYSGGFQSVKLDSATGKLVASAAGATARVELDNAGFRVYDSDNVLGVHSTDSGWSTGLSPEGRVEMDKYGLRVYTYGQHVKFAVPTDGESAALFIGEINADEGLYQPVTTDGLVSTNAQHQWRDPAFNTVAYIGTSMTASSDQYSTSIRLTPGIRNIWRLGETSGTTLADTYALSPLTLAGSYTLGVTNLVVNETSNKAIQFTGAGGRASSAVWFGQDALTGTAGALLNGRVATYGGTWATSGATGDYTAGTMGTRSGFLRQTINDTGGRIALLGTSNWDDLKLSMQFSFDFHNSGSVLEMGFVARYIDANNYLKAVYKKTSAETGSLFRMEVVKRVLGVDYVIASQLTTAGGWPVNTFNSSPPTLIISNEGDVSFAMNEYAEPPVEVHDSDLAAGGALATGKIGIWDMLTGPGVGGNKTRVYWGFQAESPMRNFQQRTFTWEGWVYPNTVDATDRIIFEVAPAVTTQGSGFRITNSSTALKVWWLSAAGTWSQVPVTGPNTSLELGTGNHIAIQWGTKNGSRYNGFQIYKNGNLYASYIDNTNSIYLSGYGLGIATLGASQTGTQPFIGVIDEVGFYPNTLGELKIYEHYTTGKSVGVPDVALKVGIQAPGQNVIERTILDESGFSNLAPRVSQVYSVTAGYTKDRTFNPAATSLGEVAAVLGSLIDDLKAATLVG
jgi:Concanavalin A-like lectin/glucanases superfamily/Carbohydrate binding domain